MHQRKIHILFIFALTIPTLLVLYQAYKPYFNDFDEDKKIVVESKINLIEYPNKPKAPNFVLYDVKGKAYELKDYRGKVVAINLWATWCPSCVREMPSMQKLGKLLKNKDFIILAINSGESRAIVNKFINENNINFPVLLDDSMEILNSWGISGLPTTLLIDKKGKITYKIVGSIEWDGNEFLNILHKLMIATE
jgi:thiol-disulfide isomerase/thioredoxin